MARGSLGQRRCKYADVDVVVVVDLSAALTGEGSEHPADVLDESALEEGSPPGPPSLPDRGASVVVGPPDLVMRVRRTARLVDEVGAHAMRAEILGTEGGDNRVVLTS